MIGSQELLLIFVLILLLFGANKLPELASSMGKALGEFKKAQREVEYELSFEYKKKAADKEKLGRIQSMVKELGIDTEGKTEDELLEAIQETLSKKVKEQNEVKEQNV
ncbi:MAG: twin-arginine translocase TatA/TatE family subunit [Methanocellales archaeon]|nr:twin-arginine translocase TatA/TatE family subunit [Methanocellales archaeon]MDD3421868.1 twin-arginine translocase TatA/TatE family subunit [Methanocellales archaeon]MDD4897972.1 twin-arginine translocase TatA/TatE family subunit [Methanocellales archaeon]MDD5446776.1 twin-arginine translocase TatA/TatE family subunit [Methanocellales archaeon]